MRYVALLLLMGSLLTGCEYEEGSQVHTVNNEFTIEVPHYMSESDKLHPDAVFQYESRFRTVYILVLKDKRGSFADMGVYVDFAKEDLTGRLTDAQLTQQYAINELNGKPAEAFEIEAQVTGQQVAYYMAVVQGEENYYRVLGWTLDVPGEDGEPGRKEKYFPEIKAMVHSFTIISDQQE